MNSYLTIIILLILSQSTIFALDFSTFHCKAATCQDFDHGLKKFEDSKEIRRICYKTIESITNISQKYGKCFNDIALQLNESCICKIEKPFDALAETIQNCIKNLKNTPAIFAKYYCGHRLMRNCADQIGLERFPYNSNYQHPPTS